MPAKTYVSIGQIKTLGAKLELPQAGGGCGTQGGEGKASCGTSDGPDDMPQEVWDVEGRPADRALRPPATVNSTASAFDFMNLDDVKPSKEVEDGTLKASAEFLATDGLIMKSRLLEKPDGNWAIMEASTTPEAAQGIKDEAVALNKKLGGWAYKLPEYKQNFLSRKFDDLVEAPQPKKEEPPKQGG